MKSILLSFATILFFCQCLAQGSWSAITAFPGPMRVNAVSFSIGGQGYVTAGNEYGMLKKDLWEYDTLTNAWTQKANFGGTARDSAVAFAIDSLGYVGLGFDGGYCTDFWKYSPATNSWTTIAVFPGTPRSRA